MNDAALRMPNLCQYAMAAEASRTLPYIAVPQMHQYVTLTSASRPQLQVTSNMQAILRE